MTDDLSQTTLALAFQDAEERKAAKRAEAAAIARAAAEANAHAYNPRRDLPGHHDTCEPHDTAMYAGTGIGALYRVPGSEHHLEALGAWRLTSGAEDWTTKDKED